MTSLTQSNKSSITVVYIMGYGRSGSTILDILLNSHPNMVSVGALNNIYNWILENHHCACGEKVCKCGFWNKIVSDHIGDCDESHIFIDEVNKFLKVQNDVEHMSNYSKLYLDNVASDLQALYKEQMDDLFRHIADKTGNCYIVDSSKSTRDCTGRPLALHLYSNVNVKIIHLVRDGRGVAWSAVKSSGSAERKRVTEFKPYNFFRASLSWTLTNLLALLTKRKVGDKNYLLLRFEDICVQPSQQVLRIGEFIGLDFKPIINKLDNDTPLSVGHNLGGNRLRFNRTVRFIPDQKWKDEMPLIYKSLFWLVAGPVARLFRYRWSDGF